MPASTILQTAQGFLPREGLPGWLVYGYRQPSPISRRVHFPRTSNPSPGNRSSRE